MFDPGWLPPYTERQEASHGHRHRHPGPRGGRRAPLQGPRSLGAPAPGSYAAFAALTIIPEADGVPAATEMLRQLVDGHEAVCRTVRAGLPVAEEANDQVTLDLLTQRLQFHETTAWMLRSMLE